MMSPVPIGERLAIGRWAIAAKQDTHHTDITRGVGLRTGAEGSFMAQVPPKEETQDHVCNFMVSTSE